MSASVRNEDYVSRDPQLALEKKYIEIYLAGKGYSLEDLKALPKDETKRLMTEACTYASLKLAEVESKAKFRQKIKYV